MGINSLDDFNSRVVAYKQFATNSNNMFMGKVGGLLKYLRGWRKNCELKVGAEPCAGNCMKGLKEMITRFKKFKTQAGENA